MTDQEREYQRRKMAQTSNEELLSEFLIANHNVESCAIKMHEQGRTDSLLELYDMFSNHYSLAKE